MAEYIDREALRKILENWRDAHADVDDEEGCGLLEDVIWEVDAQPAADVAPVVRCKDCEHWDDDPDTYGADCGPKGKCMKSFETMCADDFCSRGERKDGGADHEDD